MLGDSGCFHPALKEVHALPSPSRAVGIKSFPRCSTSQSPSIPKKVPGGLGAAGPHAKGDAQAQRQGAAISPLAANTQRSFVRHTCSRHRPARGKTIGNPQPKLPRSPYTAIIDECLQILLEMFILDLPRMQKVHPGPTEVASSRTTSLTW